MNLHRFRIAACLLVALTAACSQKDPSATKDRASGSASPPPPASCVAPRLPGEAIERTVLAALVTGWDRKTERVPITGDEPVKDCFGNTAKADWSGFEGERPPTDGQAIVRGRHDVDPEHAFFFVATGREPGACAVESGFLAYARFDAREVRIEASSEWFSECGRASYSLRPIELPAGTVYVERPGWSGTGAGKTEGEVVWVLAPPSLKAAHRFTVQDAPDCPMSGSDETCERESGRLDVLDGTLRYRLKSTSKRCSPKDGKTACAPERTTLDTQRFRLQGGDLVQVAPPPFTVIHARDFARDYAGTVASRRIVGELLREGDMVSGGYGYSGKPGNVLGYDLLLDGVMDGDRVSLTEFVARGKDAGAATGHFEGTVAPDGSFRGTFEAVDGKAPVPFAWRPKASRGVRGRFAFDVANVRLLGSTPPSGPEDPRGSSAFAYDLLLLDRRNGDVVRTIQRARDIGVHGACGPGRAAPRGRDFEDPSVLAAYKAAFPGDKVVAYDVFHDGCERAHGTLLALLVVERAGVLRAIGRRVYSTDKNALDTEKAPEFDVEL